MDIDVDKVFQDTKSEWGLHNLMKTTIFCFLFDLRCDMCRTCNHIWTKLFNITVDKQLLLFIKVFNLFCTYVSIHNWHIQIAQNQIKLFALNLFKCIQTILCSLNIFNISFFQDLLHHSQDKKLVVYNQNSHHFSDILFLFFSKSLHFDIEIHFFFIFIQQLISFLLVFNLKILHYLT